MMRTYPLKHWINPGKQEKIRAVAKEYRKLAVRLASWQWREIYSHGSLNKNLDVKTVETELSERYKQTCQYQVVGVLKSFITNRQKEFVKIVWKSKLSERKKLELFYINKYGLWFAKTVNMPVYEQGKKIENKVEEIEQETIQLTRAIFKHILKRHRKPSLKRCNLALDRKVAKITPREESEEKTASKFDYWIMFSTLETRQPIYLPLTTNEYFQKKIGYLKNFCQINIDEHKQVKVCLIKDVAKRDYVPEIPKISLDFGLRNLFASNSGDLYGRDFIDVLKKYDSYISNLASNRQRQNLKVKSNAYNSLVTQLRYFLKNEINRVINNIIDVYQPKEIVVEELNFSSPQLSRRLNRILSNSGRKIIQKKFDSLNEEFGIVITEVPAPYTSQECSVCGYVDARNRNTQATFVCQHCRTKLHADVNGARNILSRSSIKELSNVYLSKEAILNILVRTFLQCYPDIYNCTPQLLDNNPYFRQSRRLGTSWNLQYG